MLGELLDADVGSGDEPDHAEQDQADVLPEDPVEPAVAGLLVVRDQLDHRREHHAERAEADGPDESHEGANVGQGGRDDHRDGLLA